MDNIKLISILIIGVSKEQKREKMVNCIWWNYGWKLPKPEDSTEITQGTKQENQNKPTLRHSKIKMAGVRNKEKI